ncbi:MAG: sorting protein [Rhizorhabdus sp.]|nr:sorting protein [Rhizorhabdus sp.]
MLKEAVASKAAKLLMTCVCPVAGTTALSLGVPQVRDAVHKATQPRQYAKPKTRVRATPAADEGVQVASAETPCPSVTPFALNNLPLVSQPTLPSLKFAEGGPTTLVNNPLPSPPSTQSPAGASPFVTNTPVPEPETWVQIVLGFGIIGGVARVTYRRNGTDPQEPAKA